MPSIIPVKFAYAARDLWFNPRATGAAEGDHVICETERGVEIGLATSDARQVTDSELNAKLGGAQLRAVIRVASDEDLDRAEALAERGDEAMPTFRSLVSESGLEMKPVGVEYLFDGEKAVCYFAAEERVDFRQLVRDLSRQLHVRIDMRQIGVREEAAIVGGYGHCGQELCCRRFNTSFDPVSIRMAKEQDLPLNSTKISGACGRLMCCLRYEFEAYRDFKTRAPKRNAVIDTPLGKGKIIEYNTPKEEICLRLESGKQVRIALADMTASEAAHKKSEELGCPCRPDTVTRDVLDRLQSPDVQMALAELDRKNGIVPEPGPDASDIFVEPKRKRRRASDGAPAAEKSQKPEGARTRRGGQGQPASASEGASAGNRRRRRGGQGGQAAPQGQGEAYRGQTKPTPEVGQTTRRRRHHKAEASEGTPAPQQQPRRSQRDASEAGAPTPRRRTRRPGDKGGQAQGVQGKQQSQQNQQQAHPQHMKSDAAQTQGAAQAEGAKRRRRRRGGRGRGGSEGSGASAGE